MVFEAPRPLVPRLVASLPARFRRPRRSAWAAANRGDAELDSFLEGPCFDADGRLHVVDIPFGRVFRAEGTWQEIACYRGWPNGLAWHPEGRFLLADYRLGLLRLGPEGGEPEPVLETVATEGFRGLNDLVLTPDGAVLFTDQGQTGLQDPSGRVWRLWPDGRLDRLIANGPSPNGIALSRGGGHCFVAMTRACEVWRFPLRADAVVGKANLFLRLPGGVSGPDGLAVDAADRLWVAQPGHGLVWCADPYGVPLFVADCRPFGRMPTNCCLTPDGRELRITEAESGSILALPVPDA
jgi:gluconolactonase